MTTRSSTDPSAGGTAASGRRVRVLESFGRSGSQRNPYITMLAEAIEREPSLQLVTFSLRGALLARYDVVHLHWPEALVERRRPVKTLVRQLLLLLVVIRWSLLRTPVVRTVHNLDLPQGLSRRERWLLALMDRRVVLRIRLNDHTPVPDGAAVATIPHGHYRDWFARYPHAEPTPGRIAFVGLVRRYKGVESLIEAFRELPDASASLRIAGRPSTEELATALRELAGEDPRTSFRAEYLDEAAFAHEVTSAQLVVLPYRHMHNSGATLAALSLVRPVLVPDTAVNRDLAAEVGEGWLRFITGDTLTAADLRAALDTPTPAGEPDLSGRHWDGTGRAHADAFSQAMSLVGRRAR